MKKLIFLTIISFFTIKNSSAQYYTSDVYSSDSLNKKRLHITKAFTYSAYVGSLSGLYFLWYSGYEQSPFHFIDDSYGWLQMDKFGHATATYHESIFCYNMLKWSGVEEKKAIIQAGVTAYSYQAFVELFDGMSAGWGASLSDLAFNTLGSSLFVGQQLAWHEQRIKLKYSFTPKSYKDQPQVIKDRAAALYGSSIVEQWLKDYNGQSYWLSFNPTAFGIAADKFPKWLNIAVGYGAENLLGANWNIWKKDNCYYNYEHIQRYRQYFISLDIDFERIPSKSKFYKTIAPFLNVLKMPSPTIELNGLGKVKGHWLYF